MSQLIIYFVFFSWPEVTESGRTSGMENQQRVMIIGNNNVFEVGCCILSVFLVNVLWT